MHISLNGISRNQHLSSAQSFQHNLTQIKEIGLLFIPRTVGNQFGLEHLQLEVKIDFKNPGNNNTWSVDEFIAKMLDCLSSSISID